ncbi:hypothetical protein [Priestia megaterium]|uniref:hypothetical protein n=1 Tax=Priestia megaterium TaxID=1404 RepID=UPI002E1DB70C|nr:hypothetical protein [Priestia megaterium]
MFPKKPAFMYKKKFRHNYVHRSLKQTNGINALVWNACYTAVDFRASLGFPQAADETPRRERSYGFSSIPLFPEES